MSDRLEVLAFLQETSLMLRKLARERASLISPEMIRVADEIARDAANLEAELLDTGLLTPDAANKNRYVARRTELGTIFCLDDENGGQARG